jgi:quinoprotein glucose dehydrogenase
MIVATLLLSAISPSSAQTGAKNGEWRTYRGDLGNTKYSPLDQINFSNFNTLKFAWRFHTENLGPKPEYKWRIRH